MNTIMNATLFCVLFALAPMCLSEELTCPVIFDTSINQSALDTVYLDDVGSLTFVNGKMTTSRRTDPIPQISCYGVNCHLVPDEITCDNLGFSEVTGNLLWNCDSSMLPNEMRIVGANVNCEGYLYKGDDLKTKGSCGITFSIKEIPFLLFYILTALTVVLLILFPDLFMFVIGGLFVIFIQAIIFENSSDDDDDDSFFAGTLTQ